MAMQFICPDVFIKYEHRGNDDAINIVIKSEKKSGIYKEFLKFTNCIPLGLICSNHY